MAEGTKPQWRLISKPAGSTKWVTVGAAWDRDDGSFNVTYEPERGKEKFKFLMVKNAPKPKEMPDKQLTDPAEHVSEPIDDNIPF